MTDVVIQYIGSQTANDFYNLLGQYLTLMYFQVGLLCAIITLFMFRK